MSLRSLVKQAKAQTRLDHPFASYSSTGKLSCSACNVPIKHEALFAAHLASKPHRVNAQARIQAAQAAQAKRAREEEAAASKLPVDYGSSDEEDAGQMDLDEPLRKRQRVDGPVASTNALPADFFSDPSQAPAPTVPSRSPTPEPAAKDEDEDWLAFERDVLGPTPTTIAAPAINSQSATIFAEPVLYGETEEEKAEKEEEEEEAPKETDEEKRARLDLEEREELLSRIEEEEREQLEADERVEALKKRLAAVREAKATLPAAQQPGGKLDLKGARAKKRAGKGKAA